MPRILAWCKLSQCGGSRIFERGFWNNKGNNKSSEETQKILRFWDFRLPLDTEHLANLWQWLKSYFKYQSHAVCQNWENAVRTSNVPSGVPQGSVRACGHYYVIFINDLPESIKSLFNSFSACWWYYLNACRYINSSKDINQLQEDTTTSHFGAATLIFFSMKLNLFIYDSGQELQILCMHTRLLVKKFSITQRPRQLLLLLTTSNSQSTIRSLQQKPTKPWDFSVIYTSRTNNYTFP